jgi:hypothetical protein
MHLFVMFITISMEAVVTNTDLTDTTASLL